MEQWRPVVGYEGLYDVSDWGRVRNSSGHFMRFDKDLRYGYWRIELWRDHKRERWYVHKLVLEAFVSAIEGKDLGNHIDCDPQNNHVTNLEWCTQEENIQHAAKLGRMRSKHRTFTDEEVRTIRQAHANGEGAYEKLAKRFKRNRDTIEAILLRETYKDVI